MTQIVVCKVKKSAMCFVAKRKNRTKLMVIQTIFTK